MTALSKRKFYSLKEYLALEDGCEYRSEYVNGYIFKLAGGTETHNDIFVKCGCTTPNKIARKM